MEPNTIVAPGFTALSVMGYGVVMAITVIFLYYFVGKTINKTAGLIASCLGGIVTISLMLSAAFG